MNNPIKSNRVEREEHRLPSAGPGTNRSITVYRYGDPKARPKIYIQTGLHADEIPGMLVLHHLRNRLEQAAIDGLMIGQIVMVPVANPIGMAQRVQGDLLGRLDFINGRNFNRYYPDLAAAVTDSIGPLLTDDIEKNELLIRDAIKSAISDLPEKTENEALRKTLLSLSADADILIDMHCDTEANLYMYSDDHRPQLMDELCALLGCEVHIRDNTQSFCFDGTVSLCWEALAKAFPDKPVPVEVTGCTLEMRGTRDVSDELASTDASNLFQFLINAGIVDGQKETPPKALCEATPLRGVEYITSPATGVIVLKKQCGEKVTPGEVVAVLVDPLENSGAARTEICAESSGVIFNRTDQRLIEPGCIIMTISGSEILPGKSGSNLLSD